MEVLLAILSAILIAGGIIFSVLPPVPGPLLAYGAMLSTHFISADTSFSRATLIIWGVLTLLIIVADQILPIAATKKFGGTKAGVIGGMIGTVVGIFIPYGIIIGPLFGAIIGDLYGGNHIRAAFKSGFGSFIGFLVATVSKIVFSIIIGSIVVWKVGKFTIDTIIQLF